MRKRSIPLAILFSVITCGIYFLYWEICLTNDTNKLAKSKTAGGVAALIYSWLTLGIYHFYWIYMLGVKDGEISGNGDRGVLYLLLSFVGIGIFLVPILTQSTVNNAINRQKAEARSND